MTNIYSLAVVSLLVVGTASADAPKPNPDAMKAGSEFGYFVGTWKCQEKWSKTDFSPAYESTATLVATNNTDGVWIAWSYDPAQKVFIREKADNYAPGEFTHLTSKGFVGDTVAWEGMAKTPKGPA